MPPHAAPLTSPVSTHNVWARISFFAGLYPPVVMILFLLLVAFFSRLGLVVAPPALPALAITLIEFLAFLSIPAVLLAIVFGLIALRQALQTLPQRNTRGAAIASLVINYLVGALLICFDILTIIAMMQQN